METLPLMQYLMADALGLGLAACSEFRVFVPLLAASVAYHWGCLVFILSRLRRWRARRRQDGLLPG